MPRKNSAKRFSDSISGLEAATKQETFRGSVLTFKSEVKNIDKAIAKLNRVSQEVREEIKASYKKILGLVSDDLYIALGEAMESNVWKWDYGDGDIVDTGALRDSLELQVVENSILISYNQEYAGIVHFGGYIHPYGNPNVQIFMPGRPWIQSVLQGGGPVNRFDFTLAYAKYFDTIMTPILNKIK